MFLRAVGQDHGVQRGVGVVGLYSVILAFSAGSMLSRWRSCSAAALYSSVTRRSAVFYSRRPWRRKASISPMVAPAPAPAASPVRTASTRVLARSAARALSATPSSQLVVNQIAAAAAPRR